MTNKAPNKRAGEEGDGSFNVRLVGAGSLHAVKPKGKRHVVVATGGLVARSV